MKKLAFPLALVVAAALSAQPALAQKGHGHGNGHGNGGGKHQTEVRGDRSHDRDDDDDRWDDRQDSRRYRNSTTSRSSNRTLQRRVPPGWCIGRGNPHNTVANCGTGQYRYDRRYDPRYNGGVTYDRYGNRTGTTYDRYGNRTGTTYDRYGNRTGTYGSYGNNRDAYSAWKRDHDLRCRELSRQRPLDLRYQLQVRNQCAAEERDARARYGV
ncbi:MAG TPA: hypothetical protein VFJ82_27165 [Longimicrobium sp.]|nr:hypothetical protein [Longimicrobium sp.]